MLQTGSKRQKDTGNRKQEAGSLHLTLYSTKYSGAAMVPCSVSVPYFLFFTDIVPARVLWALLYASRGGVEQEDFRCTQGVIALVVPGSIF